MILSLAMCNAGDSNLYVRMLSNSSVLYQELYHVCNSQCYKLTKSVSISATIFWSQTTFAKIKIKKNHFAPEKSSKIDQPKCSKNEHNSLKN